MNLILIKTAEWKIKTITDAIIKDLPSQAKYIDADDLLKEKVSFKALNRNSTTHTALTETKVTKNNQKYVILNAAKLQLIDSIKKIKAKKLIFTIDADEFSKSKGFSNYTQDLIQISDKIIICHSRNAPKGQINNIKELIKQIDYEKNIRFKPLKYNNSNTKLKKIGKKNNIGENKQNKGKNSHKKIGKKQLNIIDYTFTKSPDKKSFEKIIKSIILSEKYALKYVKGYIKTDKNTYYVKIFENLTTFENVKRTSNINQISLYGYFNIKQQYRLIIKLNKIFNSENNLHFAKLYALEHILKNNFKYFK